MLLEGGRRVATYKLATLLALLDASAEASPTPGPEAVQAVSILELADRVIELYWPQVRTYGEYGVLRQSTQNSALILTEVGQLHAHAITLGARTVTGLRALEPRIYLRAQRKVALVLARQPLPALQTPVGSAQNRIPFLYDDSWPSYSISARTLDARGWRLHLLPGVADGLVRLGGLLRPVVERAWIDDVARHNHLTPEHELLTGFLFGAERSSLGRAARILREIEGSQCFYCGRGISGAVQVDHFVPWSRVPFDGLANLVLTDLRCCGSKNDSLASQEHRRRWMERDRFALEEIGDAQRWPAEWDRAQRITQGLYARLPKGTPLWQAVGTYSLLT
jgi:5-methylcytosine-specific restriction endonuclease McrA